MRRDGKQYAEWWEPPWVLILVLGMVGPFVVGLVLRLHALEVYLAIEYKDGKYIQIEKPSDKP